MNSEMKPWLITHCFPHDVKYFPHNIILHTSLRKKPVLLKLITRTLIIVFCQKHQLICVHISTPYKKINLYLSYTKQMYVNFTYLAAAVSPIKTYTHIYSCFVLYVQKGIPCSRITGSLVCSWFKISVDYSLI